MRWRWGETSRGPPTLSKNRPRNIVQNWFAQASCRSPEPVGMSALEVEAGTPGSTRDLRVAPKGAQKGRCKAPGAPMSG